MKRFAQIYNGKAHWIFEAEESPDFAPNIVIVEITELDLQPQEGWDFDGTSFHPPSEQVHDEEPTLEEIQMQTLLNTEFLVVLAELENM